jgi:hypothetical protein
MPIAAVAEALEQCVVTAIKKVIQSSTNRIVICGPPSLEVISATIYVLNTFTDNQPKGFVSRTPRWFAVQGNPAVR